MSEFLPSAASASPAQIHAVLPTRWSAAVFSAKAALLRQQRAMLDLTLGPGRLGKIDGAGFPHAVARAASPLFTQTPDAERALEAGKVQNLRTAARALDGLLIPAGRTFSFWRQVGRPARRRGYTTGRMLQQGCLVPSVGGGLCQLSNGLYQAALAAGCEIVERHPHSRIVPGSDAALGRDATVAWNYVDLRFRPPVTMRLCVDVGDRALDVALMAAASPAAILPSGLFEAPDRSERTVAHSCATCGRSDCFRHEAGQPLG